jgi:hypothetical protein
LEQSSPNSKRDKVGRLISESHPLPFVEDLDELSQAHRSALEALAAEPRNKKRVPREVMRQLLLALTDGQFVAIKCLAELVNRDPETLRGQYLTQMVRDGELEIAFPRTPNDPRQAYTRACIR